jgi:uncharacterized delta-60 repeat protein
MRAHATIRLWLLLAGASVGAAAIANPGDLDPSFGSAGRVFIDIPEHIEAATAIVQARDGKLLIGRWVYNFPPADDFSVMRLRTDGTLDPTFDGDGRTFVELGSPRGVTRTVLELASGRIIAAGHVTDVNGFLLAFGLVRFEASGAIDPSFGVNGVVQGKFGGDVGSIEGVVEQPDGRLVAAGYLQGADGKCDMVIVRFDPTGALDPTFGTNGMLRIDFFAAGQDDIGLELVQQADGKLVVAGRALDASGVRRLALLRLTSDGALDATFGDAGRVALDVPDVARADVSLRDQGDGKLVIAGQTRTRAGDCDSAIARLNPDGSPDATFDGDGMAQLPLGSCYAEGASTLALEPDGAVVIANTFYPQAYPSDVRIARLTPAGELDHAFGNAGTGIVEMGSGAWGSRVDASIGACMVRQSDGRIVLAASDQFDWDFGGTFFMVARLLASGSSAGMIGFATDVVVVDEAPTTATVTIRRTGGATGAVSVDFATVAEPVVNTADAADYTPVSGTLTWEDGDASDRTITIHITDDSQAEGGEVIGVVLSGAGGAPLATDHMSIIIQDDEPPPPPRPRPDVTAPPGSTDGGGAFDWLLLVGLAGAAAVSIVRRREATDRTDARQARRPAAGRRLPV